MATSDELLKEIADGVRTLASRQDALEKRMNDDKARRDAEEESEREREREAADKARRDAAKARWDAMKFSGRRDDDDDDSFRKRRDAEEAEMAKAGEEAGEEPGKAKEMAADRRKKADDDDKRRHDDDDDDDKKKRMDDAKRRADAHKFSARRDDDDDDKHRARRDAEEAELAKHLEESGESKDDARRHAKDARKKADDDDDDDDDRRRHDSLKSRLDRLERSRTRSDDDLNALAEKQHEWETVCQAHGERASRPTDGESLVTYDRRHAKRFQKFSPRWSKVDLSTLDPSVLAIATPEIRADSIAAAYSGEGISKTASLREIVRQDRTGRNISEFVGPVSVTLAPFRLPPMRVKSINKNAGAY